jgi:hypothetical protein
VAYPGGGLVIEPGGKELPPESDGMYELDWGSS